MQNKPNNIQLKKDIEDLLRKHDIDHSSHYQVLKDLMLSAILYHWEDPLVADLIPIKEGIEEIRESFKMFKKYRYDRKISIFGSARTPEDDPLYKLTYDFANKAALKGYKIITGAGPGIMAAGNRGAGPDNTFGLGLKLPYESENPIFAARPDHLTLFNNFYSRKLTFYRESDAIVVMPGGFGTMDEIFQGLTTLQTGKKKVTPFILLDEPNGTFWKEFDKWIDKNMDKLGYISKPDRSMYTLCTDADEALGIINNYYKIFHSYINIDDKDIFFQLKRKLTKEEEVKISKIAHDYDLSDLLFVRERYYPKHNLYVYKFSVKELRDYVNLKLFIQELNKL